VRIDPQVTHLARETIGAPDQPAVTDDPRTDTGFSRYVDEVSGTGEFSIVCFGEHGEIGVVVHSDRITRRVQRTSQPSVQVDVAPAKVGGQAHHALPVHQTRHAHGQTQHAPPLLHQTVNGAAAQCRDRGGRLARGRLQSGKRTPPQQDLLTGQIDGDRGQHVGADLQTDGGVR
jgi:hypothetical protein